MSASSTSDPALVRAVEGARQRTAQLVQSLDSFLRFLSSGSGEQALPDWPSVQKRAVLLATELASVQNHVAQYHDLFAATAVYPLPAFNARQERGLDTAFALLRKSVEHNVADWVVDGRELAEKYTGPAADGQPSQEEYQELWKWALAEARNMRKAEAYFQVDYTKEEREKGVETVQTGLRRKLRAEPPKDDDDDEDEDDDNEDETQSTDDSMPVDLAEPGPEVTPISVGAQLKFLTTGKLPSEEGT